METFDWFVENKLSIHFGDEKTKSIPFATKFKIKKVKKLNMKYGGIQIWDVCQMKQCPEKQWHLLL